MNNITHGIVRYQEITQSSNQTYNVGQPIIMPAEGPWIIYGIYSTAVRVNINPVNYQRYILNFAPLAGNVLLSSTPIQFPGVNLHESDQTEQTTAEIPLTIYDTNLVVPGKSRFQLSITSLSIMTPISSFMAGILFAQSIPSKTPIKYTKAFSHTFGSPLLEEPIGSLIFSEDESKITGIYSTGSIYPSAGFTSGVLYSIRLSSNDKKLQPAEFPGQTVIDAADRLNFKTGASGSHPFMPLDIQLEPGSTIDIYATKLTPGFGFCFADIILQYE